VNSEEVGGWLRHTYIKQILRMGNKWLFKFI